MKKRKMSKELSQIIESQRSFVKEHLEDKSKNEYETIDGKLNLLQKILDNNYYGKDKTWELQCLGVTFGDALSQKLGLEWIEIEDEYGVDPSLRLKNTSVILFPLTMISKRIEDDEEINVEILFDEICKVANEEFGIINFFKNMFKRK